MASYEPPCFDSIELSGERARFSGGTRGFDELGHDTFAVEVDGSEYFGEITNLFLPNGNDYNVEVISFGYGSAGDVGMPILGTCRVFTVAEIATIQSLIIQLAAAGTRFQRKPTLLREYPNAHFMGQVIFRDGWILASDEASP
ncbi:MAG TPA: hypothetical protein VEY92_03640 [Pseudoxanthomonas sp.]|nr:hypothetical protein [Pseudoxanthomonas sp.]